jgi:cytochrome oxidase Cu insertion factor (SCO1/SenC/PrrC family)
MKKTIISFLSIIVLVSTSLLGIYVINPEEEMMVHGQGNRAPDFTVVDIYDNSFTLSDHRGEVVLINFISVPCSGCKLIMDELNSVYEQEGDKIIMISIDILPEDTKEDIELAYSEYVNKWLFALDTDDLIYKYSVTEIPKVYIIDTNGDISYFHTGLIDNETLLEEIDKATLNNEVEDLSLILWIGIIGLILAFVVIIVVIIHLQKEKANTSLEYFAGFQKSSLNKYQQEYPCSTCGQPLRYLSESKKWYCDNCRKYV